MEIGNIIKAATFQRFLHLSYKAHNYFFMTVLFNIFKITQKYELRVFFKGYFMQKKVTS